MSSPVTDLESLARDYDAALLTTPGPPIVLVTAYVDALKASLTARDELLRRAARLFKQGDDVWRGSVLAEEMMAAVARGETT